MADRARALRRGRLRLAEPTSTRITSLLTSAMRLVTDIFLCGHLVLIEYFLYRVEFLPGIKYFSSRCAAQGGGAF